MGATNTNININYKWELPDRGRAAACTASPQRGESEPQLWLAHPPEPPTPAASPKPALVGRA